MRNIYDKLLKTMNNTEIFISSVFDLSLFLQNIYSIIRHRIPINLEIKFHF